VDKECFVDWKEIQELKVDDLEFPEAWEQFLELRPRNTNKLYSSVLQQPSD
jgi:hypothetical protein